MNISKNRIQTIGKVDGYVEQMLNMGHESINNVANLFGRDVKIAQKNKRVFINSGPITSSFDYTKMEKGRDFQRNIIDNLVANQKASEKNLSQGFSVLA